MVVVVFGNECSLQGTVVDVFAVAVIGVVFVDIVAVAVTVVAGACCHYFIAFLR